MDALSELFVAWDDTLLEAELKATRLEREREERRRLGLEKDEDEAEAEPHEGHDVEEKEEAQVLES